MTWNISAGSKVYSLHWVLLCYKAGLISCAQLTYPLTAPIDVAPLTEHRPIATLAHKLDRVLFKSVDPIPYCVPLSHSTLSPGVHWLQEPRSGVYNFTPWLQNIPDVNEFAFERLPPFVKSSRDEVLDLDSPCDSWATDIRFPGLVGARETRKEKIWWLDLILDWNAIASILPHLWLSSARPFPSQWAFPMYGSCHSRLHRRFCSSHETPSPGSSQLVSGCRPRSV